MAVTYNPQHTTWDYPPVDEYPESGVHDLDCKWLCNGPPPGEGLCRRRDHPECALCKTAAERRAHALDLGPMHGPGIRR